MNVYAAIQSAFVAMRNCENKNPPNREWQEKHADRIAELLRLFTPSGGGFDCGTKFNADKSTADKLVFTTEFHHMNEAGYYDGWTSHVVAVRPAFHGVNITVSGRNKNDIKDYILAVFHDVATVDAETGGRVPA